MEARDSHRFARQTPVLLAALLAVFLAARPVSAQQVELARVPGALEIRGGVGASAWVLRYGSPPTSMDAYLATFVTAGSSRAWFGHGPWLRLVDTSAGVVIGRWRFPCVIAGMVPAGTRVHVQLQCRESSAAPSTLMIAFDPASPAVPYWPSGQLLTLRVSRMESVPLLGYNLIGSSCSANWPQQAGRSPEDARARVPQAEEMVRRDPASPWLRLAAAALMTHAGDARARAMFDGIPAVESTDFTELLGLSTCLDTIGETALATTLFERGYGDFIRKGHDPRLFGALIGRLVLYGPTTGGRAAAADLPDATIERIYRLMPWGELAEVAWTMHADRLEARGRAADARIWRARADTAQRSSLWLHTHQMFRWFDGLLLTMLSGCVSATVLAIGLYLKYRPQRELAEAARLRSPSARPPAAFFGLEYWSRRERLTFAAIAFAVWYAAGLFAAYGGFFRMFAAPTATMMGHLGSAATASFVEQRLPGTSDRDLLLALSYQQAGDASKAEALYRRLPQFAESWNNLGVLLEAAGRRDEARQSFERALEIDPGLGEAVLNLRGESTTEWTAIHRQYAADRPMVAPPRRNQMFRAIVGFSSRAAWVRALAGPLGGHNQWQSGTITVVTGIRAGKFGEILLAVAMIAVLVMPLFVIMFPRREVTEGPGVIFGALERVVPGLSPSWRWLAAPALIAWTAGILMSALFAINGTPAIVMGGFAAGIPNAYGIRTSRDELRAVLDPSWQAVAAVLVALWAVNLLLIWRSTRTHLHVR